MNELGVERLKPGRTWVLRDAARIVRDDSSITGDNILNSDGNRTIDAGGPCSLRERELQRRWGCDDQYCLIGRVSYSADLTFSCPIDENLIFSNHAIVVVGNEPSRCRLSRLVDVDLDQLDRTGLPLPVRDALEAAEAQPGRSVSIRVGLAGTRASIWQIDSLDTSAANQNTGGNCPHPIWVFVRTPSGVVQLDVPEGIDGLLSEANNAKVVLVGPFGAILKQKAFDVARLPPPVSGAMSRSSQSCHEISYP